MYKVLIYVVFLCATSLIANDIHWEKDFKTGVENATKQNKPILFIYSRHTCKYCVLLEKTTLSNRDVIKKLNKEFISIVSYSDENDFIPRELWRPGTPTIWFLHPDGKPMFQPLMGAVDEVSFLKALSIVREEFDKSTQK
jgi:thioredoxin-related protein